MIPISFPTSPHEASIFYLVRNHFHHLSSQPNTHTCHRLLFFLPIKPNLTLDLHHVNGNNISITYIAKFGPKTNITYHPCNPHNPHHHLLALQNLHRKSEHNVHLTPSTTYSHQHTTNIVIQNPYITKWLNNHFVHPMYRCSNNTNTQTMLWLIHSKLKKTYHLFY